MNRLCIAICIVFLAAGCGETKKTSTDGGSQPSGALTEAAYADGYCSALEPCCAAASLKTDGVSCHALVSIQAGAGTYDSEEGAKCLAAINASAKQSGFCSNLNLALPACDHVFNANLYTKEPGELCAKDGDCARSSGGPVVCYDTSSNDADVFSCMIQRPGVLGSSPCVETLDGDSFYGTPWNTTEGPTPSTAYTCDRAAGLRCDEARSCVALGAEGEDCFSDSDCVTSAYCDPDTHCAARIADGQDCSAPSAECVAGDYCTTDAPHCTALLAANAACTAGSQCVSGVCANNACGAPFADLGLQFLCGAP